MIVLFTPAKSGALRQYRSADLQCLSAGEYEVPDDVGAELCIVYPAQFKRITGSGKGATAPTHNRAAQPPEKDKGA